MGYNPQESDLQILNQSLRTVYSKIELLNKSFKIIEQIDGELISDNYSYTASSDIRKTYNMTLAVKNTSFVVGSSSKIWFDKYIKVYIGLFNIRLQEVVYYTVGIFLFDSAGYSYDSTTKTLSLSCVDRMAELTGDRNGKLSGLSISITEGTDIRDALVSAVTQLGKIEKYRIEDVGETVPYDLTYNSGATVYDIIKELRDLYSGWETFFDGDTFICQPYPTCESDPVVLDAETIRPLVISENTDIKFTDMRNVIEIWGKCLDTDYYTDTVTFSAGIYSSTYGTIPALSDGLMLGFLAPSDNTGGDYFTVDAFTSYPIICEGNESIAPERIKSGSMYVLEYVVSGSSGYFYFCGEYQICAVAKLVSQAPSAEKIAADLLSEPTRNIAYVIEADSPFCSDLDIGEVREIPTGSDYSNIYSEDLAMQRAKYDLWRSTDLLDSVTLKMIEIPWLEVNTKIEYTSNTTGNTETYIVKTKSGSSTDGIMTIECTKFQPLYSWVTTT